MCASSTLLRRKSRRKDACSEVIIIPPIRFLCYSRYARSVSTICSITLSGTPIVDMSAAPRIVLTIPSACRSIRFALSMIPGTLWAEGSLLILRTSAMISKTAKGLTPAVSAKPLADDRDERFMVVLLHYLPAVIAQMTGVSALLDFSGFVVVPIGPTTPQIQTVLRTPPLASARRRRPVKRDLFPAEFLET